MSVQYIELSIILDQVAVLFPGGVADGKIEQVPHDLPLGIIGHAAFGLVNPGDIVLQPEAAYPAYNSGTILADGEPYWMPLKEENDWLKNKVDWDSNNYSEPDGRLH